MKPLPAWPGGPAPPFPRFRQVPLGCRARMEGGGKLGGHDSLEVFGWYHTLLSLDGSSAHPPFLRPRDLLCLVIHSFCLWSP